MTLLEQLAATVVAPVPAAVLAGMPARVLDILGICVRATELDTSRAVAGFAADTGGHPDATAVGVGGALPAAEAAFVNGVLAHSLDYDDTHLPSILHPSASVVPAALATAQAVDAGGPELLAAVAVGIEVCIRVGMAGYDPDERQSVFFERGQHATSICGALGSAAASARLRGADAAQAVDAMAVACSMASGIIEANRQGGTVKRLHCGWAAKAGVSAADLAARGITGPATALEGRFGLFEAFLGEAARPDATVDGLGQHWHAADVFYKPYPANHFTHTGIDAALAVRGCGIEVADIERIELAVAPPTVRTIGDPIEAKRSPATGYQAQFSGPYTVAAALLGGGGLGLGLGDFTDELAVDPTRRALMARVDVVGDPALLDIYPFQFPARLTVTTVDGSRITEERLHNRGGTDLPLSPDELATKFDDNVAGLLAPDRAAAVVDEVGGLADGSRPSAVMAPFGELAP